MRGERKGAAEKVPNPRSCALVQAVGLKCSKGPPCFCLLESHVDSENCPHSHNFVLLSPLKCIFTISKSTKVSVTGQ